MSSRASSAACGSDRAILRRTPSAFALGDAAAAQPPGLSQPAPTFSRAADENQSYYPLKTPYMGRKENERSRERTKGAPFGHPAAALPPPSRPGRRLDPVHLHPRRAHPLPRAVRRHRKRPLLHAPPVGLLGLLPDRRGDGRAPPSPDWQWARDRVVAPRLGPGPSDGRLCVEGPLVSQIGRAHV